MSKPIVTILSRRIVSKILPVPVFGKFGNGNLPNIKNGSTEKHIRKKTFVTRIWMNMYPKLEQLYKDNKLQYLKRYTRITGSEAIAEDIIHDSFERAMRYYPAYDSDQEIERWFSIILRNAYLDWLQQEKGRPVFEFPEDWDVQSVECDGLIRRVWREVENLIDQTKPEHKEILTLHYLKEYTITDISKFTPHKISNCAQVVSRFRSKVKELYGI